MDNNKRSTATGIQTARTISGGKWKIVRAEQIDFIGNEHPFPRLAPQYWRDAKAKELRQFRKERKKRIAKSWKKIFQLFSKWCKKS